MESTSRHRRPIGREKVTGLVCVVVAATLPLLPAMVSRPTQARAENPRSRSMERSSPRENKHTIEKLFETFNHDDMRPLEALVSPDYVGPQGAKGPAGFGTVMVGLRTAFPDLRYTVDDLLAEGDKVAARWHWTGTHKAPFRAHPATGAVVTNAGLAIFQLKEGRIVAAVLETDRLGFLQQIGVLPENVGLGGKTASDPRPGGKPAP
jgi:steroid delta-isomerase-like uncharacterized protein